MSAFEFDEETARRLLAVYTTPDVVAQRHEIIRALGPDVGERILDVGSGPGFLASTIADAVGSTGVVCGVEISEPLNAIARAHCEHQAWVEIRHGNATSKHVGKGHQGLGEAWRLFFQLESLPVPCKEALT